MPLWRLLATDLTKLEGFLAPAILAQIFENSLKILHWGFWFCVLSICQYPTRTKWTLRKIHVQVNLRRGQRVVRLLTKNVDTNCCCRTASTRPRRLNPDFLCFSSSVARFFFLSNVNGLDQMQDEAHGDEARDSSPGPKKQENPQIIQMVTKDPNQVFYK